jgi:hypothetical protein
MMLGAGPVVLDPKDEIDDHFKMGQWTAPPVLGDHAGQAKFGHV